MSYGCRPAHRMAGDYRTENMGGAVMPDANIPEFIMHDAGSTKRAFRGPNTPSLSQRSAGVVGTQCNRK